MASRTLRLLTIRIPADVLGRLNDLIPWMEESTEIGRIKPSITRSDVLRQALDVGVDVLENRQAMAALAAQEERILRGRA
mgnify:CR=1 FL=1